jgi:glutathione S-transferase
MSLTLHLHPLSSFCHKALIALYENDTPFQPHLVDLGNAESAAAFKRIWPVGKFPVLRDDARNRTVAESSIIIKYLDQHYPGPVRLLPADPERALRARMHDRFYDLHVHLHSRRSSATGCGPPVSATRSASTTPRRGSRPRLT